MTHQHLLAVLSGEIARRPERHCLRILDAGCGDGLLLEYLAAALPLALPGRSVALYGFDVGDHGLQGDGFLAATVERLAARVPGTDWRRRLALIPADGPWPYPDGFFDAIVSNQVLEHVADHPLFFRESARVLAEGGFAAHLFPLGHCVVEPHLRLPLAHWFDDAHLIRGCIVLFSRLGLGGYRSWKPEAGARTVARYAREHADFLVRLTNYRTQGEMLQLAKGAGLHGSFRYTLPYYREKLRTLLGRRPVRHYLRAPGLASTASVLGLRYVASATLLTVKDRSYARRLEDA